MIRVEGNSTRVTGTVKETMADMVKAMVGFARSFKTVTGAEDDTIETALWFVYDVARKHWNDENFVAGEYFINRTELRKQMEEMKVDDQV